MVQKPIILLIVLLWPLLLSPHLQALIEGARVLYIGDSQSAGFLGSLVTDQLRQSIPKTHFDVYGISSSSPRHWSDPREDKNGNWLCNQNGRHNKKYPVALAPRICHGHPSQSALENLISNDYDLVYFQFLGNSVGFSESYIKRKIRQTLAQLDGADCVFITSPPYYYTLDQQNRKRALVESYYIEAIGDRCTIIQGMSQENLKHFAKNRAHYQQDRKHLSRKGAKALFDQILPYLPNN